MTLDFLVSEEKSSSARCWCGSCVGEDAKVCPSCSTLYHRECWADIDGCATYGCDKRGKVLDVLASEFIGGDLVVPGDFSGPVSVQSVPVRNGGFLSRWYTSIRNFVGFRDDSWIDSYLDKVRASLKSVLFTQWSDRVDSRGAVEFCESRGARLVSAQEAAFARVLGNSYDRYHQYTDTFVFGFRKGNKSFVAYDDLSHRDWLYLMDKESLSGYRHLGKNDPVVGHALMNAELSGRIVQARQTVRVVLSCVPDKDGCSDFTRDGYARAILGRAVQPYGLWLYRKFSQKSLTLWEMSCSFLEQLSGGQVYVRPLRLGGGGSYFDIYSVVDASSDYYASGRAVGVVSAQKMVL